MKNRNSASVLWPGLGLMIVSCLALISIELHQVLWSAPQLTRGRQLVNHSFDVITTARSLEWALRNAERAQRNYVISGDTAHLAEYRGEINDSPALLARLQQLTWNDVEQRSRMPSLEDSVNTKLAELRTVDLAVERDGIDAGLAVMRQSLGVETMRAVQRQVDAAVARERDLLEQRRLLAIRAERSSADTALAGGILALVVMAIGTFLVVHALRNIRAAEKVRRDTEEQFRLLVGGVTDYAIYMLDPQGRVNSWNAGSERIKGYAADEVIGQHVSLFYTEEDRRAAIPRKMLEIARREGRYETEALRVRKDGSRFWASVVIDRLLDRSGRLVGFANITRDITERLRQQQTLEQTRAALAQSQKIEALGQLTGGVAHDFNNLLSVILGGIDLVQRSLQKGDRDVTRYLDIARRGVERASALTRRLLAFSRRQPLEPKALDANRLVNGMVDLLRRSLGEGIAIETLPGSGLWPVYADANQLENAILNLALNARDAMPRGGKLTIETANMVLEESELLGEAEPAGGRYVMIAVSDTGVGMAKEIIEKAFEPFFTTKEVGQGTGLGLSQVYGFIKQSRGHVKIDSEPGQGTTVKLYLPRLESLVAETASEPRVPAERSGKETILAVEDDEDVLKCTAEALADFGYRVLVAPDAHSALQVLDREPDVQLLFTDVGLPGGVNGRELADEVRRRKPSIKVLFTTAYARDAIFHHGQPESRGHLIAKPFTQSDLASRIRQVLDSRSSPH